MLLPAEEREVASETGGIAVIREANEECQLFSRVLKNRQG